jgi:hypothetical protein
MSGVTEATGRTDKVPIHVVHRGERTRPEGDFWNRGMPPLLSLYCIFAEWNCFHRQRNGQSSKGGQHINASRLEMPQGRQLRRWQEVGGGRPWRLVGVEGKKQKFGIRSVFGDPLPTATEYFTSKRDWCFLFNLRHTHTTLAPHWRNSSTIADESECGCGVVDTSPIGSGLGFGCLFSLHLLVTTLRTRQVGLSWVLNSFRSCRKTAGLNSFFFPWVSLRLGCRRRRSRSLRQHPAWIQQQPCGLCAVPHFGQLA